MKISAIKYNKNNIYKQSFKSQTYEPIPLSSHPSEEFVRKKNNVLRILFPTILASLGISVVFFTLKSKHLIAVDSAQNAIKAAKEFAKKAEQVAEVKAP